MSTVKVVTGTPTSTNAPVTQTSDAHASAIPPGAAILGSPGNQKPSVSNGVAFQTCTVPVHIYSAFKLYFYVNGFWIKPNGAMASGPGGV